TKQRAIGSADIFIVSVLYNDTFFNGLKTIHHLQWIEIHCSDISRPDGTFEVELKRQQIRLTYRSGCSCIKTSIDRFLFLKL
ncbi:MAG: hypothetical protein KA394_05160, partial [Fluviicola sp.]|nr:hypothetical protein [Fluviicola sp.]